MRTTELEETSYNSIGKVIDIRLFIMAKTGNMIIMDSYCAIPGDCTEM